ncbi:coiled-coil domain-containing protein 174-like [Argonauta hians]
MSNISSAGLIELKAELFRKQEEFKKEKLQCGSANRIKGKKSVKLTSRKESVWSKKNSGVAERSKKDYVAKKEEEDSLEKSRKALELKSQLYEKIVNDRNIPDDDGSMNFLVDFQKKAIDRISKEKLQDSSEESKEEDFDSSTEDPEEKWVEYTDSLGRTRTCLQKDVQYMQDRDKKLGLIPPNEKPEEIESESTKLPKESSEILNPQDRYRQMLHEKWDAEERKTLEGPIGPIHYENVRFDEVRTHGVGYFSFSKEEAERKEQMNLLKTLRDQTKEERSQRETLKEKRETLMAARLKKVKNRQRAKLGLPPEPDPPKSEENTCEKQVEIPVKRIEPIPRESFPTREWDIGKDEFFEREKQYFSQRRNERNYDFAPPDFYKDVPKETKRQSNEIKHVFQEIKKCKMNSKKQTVIKPDKVTELSTTIDINIDVANIPLPGETFHSNVAVDNSSESNVISSSSHQEHQPVFNHNQPTVTPTVVFPTSQPLYNSQDQTTGDLLTLNSQHQTTSSGLPLQEMPSMYSSPVDETSVPQDVSAAKPKLTIVDKRLIKNINSLQDA